MAGLVFLVPPTAPSAPPLRTNTNTTTTTTTTTTTDTDPNTTTATSTPSETTSTTTTAATDTSTPSLRLANPYARTTWRPHDASDPRPRPPDYNRHHLDRYVDASSPSAAAALLRRRATLPPSAAAAGDHHPDAEEAAYSATDSFSLDLYNRLSLTFDKTLIYPTHPPAVALYYLPQQLTHSGDAIALELSVSALPDAEGRRGAARGESLYRMTRGPMWPWPHGPEYLIKPQREGCCVCGVARMTRSKGVTGSKWSVIYRGYSADAGAEAEAATCEIQWAGGRWTHRGGVLLAAEEQTKELKLLVFQDGIVDDRPLQDLLVSAWCVRLWHKLSPGPSKKKEVAGSGEVGGGTGDGEGEGGEGGEGEDVAAAAAPAAAPVVDAGRRWAFVRRTPR